MIVLHSLNHDLGKEKNGINSALENGASTK